MLYYLRRLSLLLLLFVGVTADDRLPNDGGENAQLERILGELIGENEVASSAGRDGPPPQEGEVELNLRPDVADETKGAPAEPDSIAATWKKAGRPGQPELVPGFFDAAQSARKSNPMEVRREMVVDSDGGGGSRLPHGLLGNVVFLSVTTVCTMAAVVGLMAAGIFWHRLHKEHVAAQEAEYPQYGVIGPAKEKKTKRATARARGDENMAYSAQLHHYQQTKQKIISMEQSGGGDNSRGQESEESEGECEEGDYSVYECPGLAPTGDIEVANPLFENGAPRRQGSDDAPAEEAAE